MDRTLAGWQGAALDLRYRFLDRETALFGLTLALETHGNRIDETTASREQNYGTELTLALERDLIPGLAVATLNLGYQPEWTHFAGVAVSQQEFHTRGRVRGHGAGATRSHARRGGALFPQI